MPLGYYLRITAKGGREGFQDAVDSFEGYLERKLRFANGRNGAQEEAVRSNGAIIHHTRNYITTSHCLDGEVLNALVVGNDEAIMKTVQAYQRKNPNVTVDVAPIN